MASRETVPQSALAFLTFVEHPQHGLFGGLLVLNAAARPLEFHCTAPVKPNRAQEILFGPTLEAYLYGEHVGGALLEKATVAPSVVCTDRAAALALREHVGVPVVWVMPCQAVEADDAASRDRPVRMNHRLATFQIGTQELAVASAHGGEVALVTERLCAFAEQFDLSEPFTRVRGAIEEAQRGGR